MADRKRLSRQDWVSAACDALAAGGIAAVAVEPIAGGLGTTKGSFYWHFADRGALLAAALEHWEHTETDEVIALVGTEGDPAERLRTLLRVALGSPEGARAGASIELALQPHADHPVVAPVLERVTRRRLSFLDDLFRQLGFPADEARRRSLLAYTAYLGHAQLVHATPALVPHGGELAVHADRMITVLTAR